MANSLNDDDLIVVFHNLAIFYYCTCVEPTGVGNHGLSHTPISYILQYFRSPALHPFIHSIQIFLSLFLNDFSVGGCHKARIIIYK